jgi:esterase
VLQNLLPETPSQHGPGRPPGYRWRCNLPLLHASLDYFASFPSPPPPPPLASALAEKRKTPPTLFLAGGKSKYLIPDMRADIDRFFPGADIQTIPDAGHWVHADQPAEFLRRVGHFVDAHDST